MKPLLSFQKSYLQSRPSQFDFTIYVNFVVESDYEYEIFKPIFEDCGYAASLLNQKLMIFDTPVIEEHQISKYEVDFIEAHEYSHFKLGENAKESECDWLGIANLWKAGKKLSAKAGIDLFENRNVMKFDTSDLPGYQSWEGACKLETKKMIKECNAKGFEVMQVLKDTNKYIHQLNTIDRFNKNIIMAYAWDVYAETIGTKLT
jgi:hypothetical protein